MTIINHYKELLYRIFYLIFSYSMTVSILVIYYHEWLSLVLLPFWNYPKIQWQFQYGLEGFYVFWNMIFIGGIIWVVPLITLQYNLYKRIGQWKKDTNNLFRFTIYIIYYIIGYIFYYKGYPWFIALDTSNLLNILVQPTMSDLMWWFYRCLTIPILLFTLLNNINLEWIGKILENRHYYWLISLSLCSIITPPDGFTQFLLWIPIIMWLEYQIIKKYYRDVTKR